MPAVVVHLVRHGRVASHRGDVPVTAQGLTEIESAGRRFIDAVQPGEIVHILTTSTIRSRDTAMALYQLLGRQIAESETTILAPVEEWAIRNPDLFIAGRRVEMVSTAAAMFELFPDLGVDADAIDRIPFYHDFFRDPDRVGFWLRLDDPPGEDAHSVGRRAMHWALSLAQLPSAVTHRYICVTHSPVMRAVLARYLLTGDPGEPEWVESIDIALHGDTRTITFRGRQANVAAP